jgi:probable F420-dependent oxidoreductase
MKVGVQYQRADGSAKGFARRAEAEGFDSVFCGDHVGHLYDGIAMLGAFAGATESITIGSNLLVAPYRPAAVVAKALATIAMVAPGRVVAGFGVGGEFPGEFTATGADLRRRGAYTDEALAVIGRLWSGEPVTHHGRFVTLEGFQLDPAPSPPPPIWIGGRSEAALARAVRFGDAYSPYLVSPAQLAKRRARLAELAEEAGRRPDSLSVSCLVTLVPAADAEAGIDRAFGALRLSGSTRDSVRAHYLLGGGAALVERAAEYRAAGADHLVLGCLPGGDADLEEFFEAAVAIRAAAASW